MFDQSGYCVSAPAFIPVGTVANYNTQFRFFPGLADVIVGTVADVLTLRRVYSKLAPGQKRGVKFAVVVGQVLGESHSCWWGGIKISKLGVCFPVPVRLLQRTS